MRNIAKGGAAIEVTGMKELQAKLRALALEDPATIDKAQKVLGDAASIVREQVRASMMIAGWPSILVTRAAFGVSKTRGRKKLTALAGMSKGFKDPSNPLYIEWRAARRPSPFALKAVTRNVPPGGLVGMGWATMWEFGTTRMPAHPAFRPAIQMVRSKVRETVANGFIGIIHEVATHV